MKNMLSLASLLSMFLLFSSCGGGDSTNAGEESPKGDSGKKEETISETHYFIDWNEEIVSETQYFLVWNEKTVFIT
jgi:hypothetical protein